MPAYTKTTWVNGTTPAINATNLNKIEQGIADAVRKDGSEAMSAQLVTIAGSAATPAIAPTGDSNTGIFFPAADTIAFGEGGAEAMRITSAGNVGIGETNPSQTLDVNGIIRTGTALYFRGTNSYPRIRRSTDDLIFDVNTATSAIVIKDGGNVGIGTTNPQYKLDVQGGTGSFIGSSGVGAIRISGAGGSWFWCDNPNGNTLRFSSGSTAGTNPMVLTDQGNVGIGTTSPASLLQIGDGASTSKVFTLFSPYSTSESGKIIFKTNNNYGSTLGIASVYAVDEGTVNENKGALILATGNNAAPTERMRITTAGNVGIGTSSPSTKLHVVGSQIVSSTTYNGPNEITGTFIGSDGSDPNIDMRRWAGSGTIHYTGKISVKDSNALCFFVDQKSTNTAATTERMRIDSSGNVGVGNTPASWGSGYTALSVKNAGNSISSSGQNQLLFSSNAYDSSAGAWKYNNAGSYANLMEIGSSGYLFYQTTSTQGAGNSITWSEKMRLDTNGYLLIGYTSSNGAYPLQVNGQIFATSSTIATSDGRYKKDIVSLDGALDIVAALNPVQFNWKEHPVHKFNTDVPTIGFIAQEVAEVLKDKAYLTSVIKKSECTWETETGETVEREVTRDVETQVEREVIEEVDGEEIARTITETVIEQVTETVTEPVKETHTEEFYGIAESNMIAILTKAIQELKTELDAVKAQLAGN